MRVLDFTPAQQKTEGKERDKNVKCDVKIKKFN